MMLMNKESENGQPWVEYSSNLVELSLLQASQFFLRQVGEKADLRYHWGSEQVETVPHSDW